MLAYALPFEGTHIVVFYDRVEECVRADLFPTLLAYVLVHEITHILQEITRHSATGIMKRALGPARLFRHAKERSDLYRG